MGSSNDEASGMLRIGSYTFEPRGNRLLKGDEVVRLEPKVADLLTLLAEQSGQVVLREELMEALWPDTIVGEDTLARSVSKLRRSFGDDPKTPLVVETVPKRGYRLLPDVEVVDEAASPVRSSTRRGWRRARWGALGAGVAALLIVAVSSPPIDAEVLTEPVAFGPARAEDLYMQFTRRENEAAIALFERAIERDPADTVALAGLSKALVQRTIRWPGMIGVEAEGVSTLTDALASGQLTAAQAKRTLGHAVMLAERAVRIDPKSAEARWALGLARTASGDLAGARRAYEAALALQSGHWPALVNLGELEDMDGRPARALDHYTAAYDGMQDAYALEPQRVGPWMAPLGVLIADRQVHAGRPQDASLQLRRVLSTDPFHPAATAMLADLLVSQGAADEAAHLCVELTARVGDVPCPITPIDQLQSSKP